MLTHRRSTDVYPNYTAIIKEPMDIATLQARASSGHYSSLEAFDHDASLIFRNCYKFNTRVRRREEMASKSERAALGDCVGGKREEKDGHDVGLQG